MNADELPSWSIPEIERLASSVAASSGLNFGLRPNLERILQSSCNASIESLFGLAHHKTLAMVCRRRSGRGRKYVVLVDQRLIDTGTEAEYRFAIAEEIGHICLHEPLVAAVQTADDFIELHSRPDWRRLEDEAGKFARALVISPTVAVAQVSKIYQETCSQVGYGNAMRTYQLVCSRSASLFAVPLEEVRRRFAELPYNIADRVIGSASARAGRLLTIDELMGAERAVPSQFHQQSLFTEDLPMH